MTCDEAEILLHALIDGELDAGHAREVEEHIAGCPRCAAQLAAYREMSKTIAEADLHFAAPAALRQRIEAALPLPQIQAVPSRRAVLRGFAMGSAVSAIAASGIVAVVLRGDDEQRDRSEDDAPGERRQLEPYGEAEGGAGRGQRAREEDALERDDRQAGRSRSYGARMVVDKRRQRLPGYSTRIPFGFSLTEAAWRRVQAG